MLYINFEDERLTGMKAEDLNLLLEVHLEMYGKRPILFLDEIQNVSGWEKFARRMVATNLLRKYGRNDAVYFYNQSIEVDFYIPDDYTAIQACYSLDNSDGTFDREVKALLKITEVLECKKLLIITRDTERTLEMNDRAIEVVPVWKWRLS